MRSQDLENIVNYVVNQGLAAVRQNTNEHDLPLDYVGIFAKDQTEYEELERILKSLGAPGDKTATSTGMTCLLDRPIMTPAGPLKVLKIRQPDQTRPQRGAPDFKVGDYEAFKKKYLTSGSNFSLIIRKDYEMLELKGLDVLVYFPSQSFDERQTN